MSYVIIDVQKLQKMRKPWMAVEKCGSKWEATRSGWKSDIRFKERDQSFTQHTLQAQSDRNVKKIGTIQA